LPVEPFVGKSTGPTGEGREAEGKKKVSRDFHIERTNGAAVVQLRKQKTRNVLFISLLRVCFAEREGL
jgi:hypothetical protein